MIPPSVVSIHYRRPPDRLEVFTQRLLVDDPEVKVTFAQNVPFDPPILIEDRVVLEAGSDAVWFTFPEVWHDIGRFHRADGTFTGVYANILTPPLIRDDGIWHTTDLFLDVWVSPIGELTILDEDQLEEALALEWISPEQAVRAQEEVARIQTCLEAGSWPPEIVEEWTLDRARRAVRDS
jgi:predicted RNA-binding protein associated with RNAse of E/G family